MVTYDTFWKTHTEKLVVFEGDVSVPLGFSCAEGEMMVRVEVEPVKILESVVVALGQPPFPPVHRELLRVD